MRILVVGAGAIGGYFGDRLGDVDLPTPPVISEDALAETFDLVLLASTAYDLEGAMASFTRAVGSDTAILPLLNGIRHLGALQASFGVAAVLGGQCLISATLDPDGRVVHLGDAHIQHSAS
jgi:2-dehydropantoate 2-reductase